MDEEVYGILEEWKIIQTEAGNRIRLVKAHALEGFVCCCVGKSAVPEAFRCQNINSWDQMFQVGSQRTRFQVKNGPGKFVLGDIEVNR